MKIWLFSPILAKYRNRVKTDSIFRKFFKSFYVSITNYNLLTFHSLNFYFLRETWIEFFDISKDDQFLDQKYLYLATQR